MAEDASIPHTTDNRDLRQRLKAERARLPASERLTAGAALAGTLATLDAFGKARLVAGYWSVGGEIPLHAVLARLPESTTYCLPRLASDGRLLFAPWRPGQPLECNRYGIPEPDLPQSECLPPCALDLALLPLLAFNRRGHRLGMGAGCYDRSFAERRTTGPPPLLVGVGYAFQECDPLRLNEWDVPLDYVATERELIHCP